MFLLTFIFSMVVAHAKDANQVQAYFWTDGSPAKIKKILPTRQIQMIDRKYELDKERRGGIVPVRERDAAIFRAGLKPHVEGMDEMRKDLLVADAQWATVEQLKKFYPKLPGDCLVRLSLDLRKKK